MIKTVAFAILLLGFSASARAADQCSQIFAFLGPADLATFKQGQMALAKSLYELYLRRPDFRLQTLEVPGVNLQLKDGTKALRFKEDLQSADALIAQQEDRAYWQAFAHYDQWKKQNGPGQIFAQRVEPEFHRHRSIKSFSLPDLDFEMRVATGAGENFLVASGLSFSPAVRQKYPQLFVNRTRVEGATAFEQSWNLAYQNLMHYLRALLNTPEAERKISLSPEQWRLIQKVYHSRGKISQFKIVSGKEQPDTFKVDDVAHRLAVTGDKVGSDIQLNSDLGNKPMDLATTTGILLHELAHHHGYKDTVDRPLDKVAAALTDYIRKTSEVKKIQGPLGENIELVLFRPLMMDQGKVDKNRSGLDAWGSRIVLFDGHGYWDLTNDIVASIPLMPNDRLNFFSLKDFEISLTAMRDHHPRKQVYGIDFDIHFVASGPRGDIDPLRVKMFMALTLSKQNERPGLVTWPTVGLSVFPVRMTSSEFAPRQRQLPAKVLENKILTPSVKSGEVAQIRAVVQTPKDVGDIHQIWIDFKSNQMRDMIGVIPNQTIQLSKEAGDKFTVNKLANGSTEILVETQIKAGTASQELTLEGINFIYQSGDFSYLSPKFKETLKITEAGPVPTVKLKNLELGGGIMQMPAGMPKLFNFFQGGAPASVAIELEGMGFITHAILVGDVDRLMPRGIATREGFVANFGAGGSSAVSELFDRGSDSLRTVDFAVSTQKEIWGFGAKRIHVEGLYLRDVNFREIYIPFGTNFSIFLEN